MERVKLLKDTVLSKVGDIFEYDINALHYKRVGRHDITIEKYYPDEVKQAIKDGWFIGVTDKEDIIERLEDYNEFYNDCKDGIGYKALEKIIKDIKKL